MNPGGKAPVPGDPTDRPETPASDESVAGASPSRWARSWTHFWRRLLPTWWIFLFCCTHLPRPQLGGPPQSDKVLHFTVFGLLAFLFWKCFETFGPLSGRFVWTAAIVLLGYATFDEATQPLVARDFSWEDLVADWLGVATVLGALEAWRRRKERAEPGS